MALKLFERYAGRANPASIDYPQGSFKNKTAPTATDGTLLEQDWANDIQGFLQSLLKYRDLVASGQVDKVGASQYFDALFSEPSEELRGIPLVATASEAKSGVNKSKMISPSALKAFSGDSSLVVFSSPGATTFTVPDILRSGSKKPYVIVIGAGGGCVSFGGTLSRGAAGGGASEGFVDLTGVSSVMVTVGAGAVGVAGGVSSFGSYMSATGGEPGAAGSGTFSRPGEGKGGSFNRSGSNGGGPDQAYSGEGGSSPYSVSMPRSGSGLQGRWPGGGAGAGSSQQLGAHGAVIIQW